MHITSIHNNRRFNYHDGTLYEFNVRDLTYEVIKSYEELQAMGGFTDQEITLIRLRFGPLRHSLFISDAKLPLISIQV